MFFNDGSASRLMQKWLVNYDTGSEVTAVLKIVECQELHVSCLYGLVCRPLIKNTPAKRILSISTIYREHRNYSEARLSQNRVDFGLSFGSSRKFVLFVPAGFFGVVSVKMKAGR